MLITAFLSMWINNTATTGLMAPIALAVLQQMREKTQHLHSNLEAPPDREAENSQRAEEMETFIPSASQLQEKEPDAETDVSEPSAIRNGATGEEDSLGEIQLSPLGDTEIERHVEMYIKGLWCL